MLVITYDEHGGFFDHVPPPTTEPPGDPYTGGFLRSVVGAFIRRHADFDFRRMGVRVPAVIVSPWIGAGRVDNHERDHSCIPRTVRELFASGAEPLTDREDAVAPFWSLVDLPAVREGDALPTLGDLIRPVVLTGPEEEPHQPLANADSFTQALTAVALLVADNLDLPEDMTIGSAHSYMQPVVAEGGDDPLNERVKASMERFMARAAAASGDG